ncbi:MAG: hypothetical protein AAB382_10685 [Chloroflexota bacterium]
MNKTSNFAEWRKRLNALGFGEMWDELFLPGSPLAFLTAQGLRVAQPLLGAFTDDTELDAITALADRLEAPENTETRR